MATDVARLALQIDVTGARRAQSAMESLRSGSVVLTRATEEQIAAQFRLQSSYQALANTGRRAAGIFRLQRGAIQQAGYQIGDFAVQVGAGQSALIAFSQQGSQLAGILGPGGAVIGAFIAVAAAIAGPFFRSMDEGEDKTKSLRERILDLRDSVDELTDAQIRQVKVEFFAENRERLQQINEFRGRIIDLREELEAFSRAGADGTQVTAGLTDPDEARAEINRLTAEIDTLFQTGNQASEELNELINGIDETGEAAEKATERAKELSESFVEQAETLRLNERQTALYKLQRLEANGADAEAVATARQQINASFDKIEAFKQEEERLKLLREQYKITAAEDPLLQQVSAQDRGQGIIDGIREEAEAVRMGLDQEFAIRLAHKQRVEGLQDALRLNIISSEQERARLEVESLRQRNEQLRALEAEKNQIFSQGQTRSLELTGQFFGNLADAAAKGGRDQFQAYQNLASAQAGIAAALSIASVLGDPTVPTALRIPLALSIGALAGAQVAQIQNQEYQGSYLGGGFTGTGSRSGGVDGNGGFPAILHPNETVIDHAQGQSMGGDVMVQINDMTSGSHEYETEETTDQEGQRRLRVIIRDTVNQNIARGEHNRALGSQFDLKARGRRT